jgi:ABC-type transporter Mla subunit MlaD
MKGILKFFMPEKEYNYFEEQKSIALIIFNFIAAFFSIVLISLHIFFGIASSIVYIIIPLILIFVIIDLFLLKKMGIRIAGNLFVTVLIIFQLISLNKLSALSDFKQKYIQGFYLILALYVFSVLFSSKRILLLNFLLILGTTIRIYVYAIGKYPEQQDYFNSGFTFHLITLILIGVTIYFAIKFAETAIKKANEETEKNKNKSIKLLRIIEGVQETSKEIFSASEQLSTISQQVSESATEQAATTEEVAASIDQMFSLMSSTAENADLTGKTSEIVTSEMKNSVDVFMQTIQAVSDIVKKISIIIEIAEKTDILSINAAIEAAKAGESGRGFAVVAQEIRKLADNTKKASDEIINLSHQGQQISEIAKEKLSQLIPELTKSTKMILDIVGATNEQKQGIEQINDSVVQLSNETNKNSSAAEEMSASAKELSELALDLEQLVADIRTEQ